MTNGLESAAKAEGILSKVGPGDVFSGVSAFVGFINGISDAKKTEEFRSELLSSLQKIQSELKGIRQDLDKILDELKKIEKTEENRELRHAYDAIQIWGEAVESANPDNLEGIVSLADEMAAASGDYGTPALISAMDTIHNSMVGEDDYLGGSNLIKSLDLDGVLLLRERLNQGLHLMVFMCAFSDKQPYKFGALLWQWSCKFRQQTTLILESPNLVTLLQPLAWPDYPLFVGDTIAFYETLRPNYKEIGLYLWAGDKWVHGYSGTLGLGEADANLFNPIREPLRRHFGFDEVSGIARKRPDGRSFACLYADMQNGETSLDPDSDLARQCLPSQQSDRWLKVLLSLGPYGEAPNTLANRGALFASARAAADKTFLGAAAGQLAWVGKDRPFVGCICDGNSLDAPLLVYDANNGTVRQKEQEDLQQGGFDMLHGLWSVAWSEKKDQIEISPLSAQGDPEGDKLTKGASGQWVISQGGEDCRLQISISPPNPVRMTNSLKMAPALATISTTQMPEGKPVLFHAF